MELDERGEIISYEEFHPFGTTSYRSGRSETEVSLKRYKYVGKERDEETGLYYYGARYYSAWLGRFVSVDPLAGKFPNFSPYAYGNDNPLRYSDPSGMQTEDEVDQVHTVQKGETLWGIAQQNNTTVDEIRANNPNLPEDATKLQIGTEIDLGKSKVTLDNIEESVPAENLLLSDDFQKQIFAYKKEEELVKGIYSEINSSIPTNSEMFQYTRERPVDEEKIILDVLRKMIHVDPETQDVYAIHYNEKEESTLYSITKKIGKFAFEEAIGPSMIAAGTSTMEISKILKKSAESATRWNKWNPNFVKRNPKAIKNTQRLSKVLDVSSKAAGFVGEFAEKAGAVFLYYDLLDNSRRMHTEGEIRKGAINSFNSYIKKNG